MVVEMNCTVSCGIPTTLVMKGELIYEADFIEAGQYVAQVFENIAEVTSIFGSISRWVYETIFEKLFGFGILVLIVVTLCIAIKFFFWTTVSVYAPTTAFAVGRRRNRKNRHKLL
ncbi:hypothetical protein CRE_22794 [Caenorhabditis remanei]|uniref:Uncharacterized protein n=1 Tax=Caenorhabditis remanei TaxID=31234 RepID=E3MHK5_CAERE|nr:hypothetical protein CRE_22794 [Caenorhabditis remanei]